MKYPEMFDICAGLTISKLYRRFPHETNLDFRTLSTEIARDFPEIPPEDYLKIFAIIRNTLDWLEQTDFIVCGDLSDTRATNTHLSERGLYTLKLVPDNLDTNDEPLGEFLSDAVDTGRKDTLIKGVGYMIEAAAA